MIDIRHAKDLSAADPTQLSNPFVKRFSISFIFLKYFQSITTFIFSSSSSFLIIVYINSSCFVWTLSLCFNIRLNTFVQKKFSDLIQRPIIQDRLFPFMLFLSNSGILDFTYLVKYSLFYHRILFRPSCITSCYHFFFKLFISGILFANAATCYPIEHANLNARARLKRAHWIQFGTRNSNTAVLHWKNWNPGCLS